jgi:TnpA family transposase
MRILNAQEEDAFESPPVFTVIERSRFFDFPAATDDLTMNLRTPTNKVCFLVMLGYFKATGKFFKLSFHRKDIRFVAQKLGIPAAGLKTRSYNRLTYKYHKKIILEHCGFKEFNREAREVIAQEIRVMVRSQVRPKLVLFELLEILNTKRIEIPSYHTLSTLIVEEINNHRKTLSRIIEQRLPEEVKQMLDGLFEKVDEDKENTTVQRYKLTLLKKFNQSMKPMKIKENTQDLLTLRELYQQLEGIVSSLNLPQEGIKYYANSVIKSEIFQVTRRSAEDKYLHLVTFTVHQYFRLHDTLIDTLLASVQNTLNSAVRDHKEEYYEKREQRSHSFHTAVNYLVNNIHTISQITSIVKETRLSDAEKIERIIQALPEEFSDAYVEELVTRLKKESEGVLNDSGFYDVLERKSVKLQNRVSGIVKIIDFTGDSSSKNVIEAIAYYRAKDGIIDVNAPLDFLEPREREILCASERKIRTSLYKVLLFVKIADTIKAGTLNVTHSYKYRSLDDYLIPKSRWEKDKEEYLRRAGLGKFVNPRETLHTLENNLDLCYHNTNENILSGDNRCITFRENGSFQLTTPKIDEELSTPVSEFFPRTRYISLLEVLSTVNKSAHFLDAFEHWQVKYTRARPHERVFWAGIIGYGCNIGTNRIAKISRYINESELENTINWYFSDENIKDANDRIIRVTDKLELPNIYRKDRASLHTGSDGQKFNVAVDSIHANYSFKYFGKGKGVTVYTFVDERNLLFHSTVISASEREAAYVIDGLMHNDVVKSDIHSTDTHGYSKILSGVVHLLGFSFAPRIKSLNDLQLYSFRRRRFYEREGYKILPDSYIDTKFIEDNWDDILRFIATIKLRETSASQLFRRLNSYSKQHPLYLALQEFGKITRTIFVLRYIDDVELRQAIMGMLNKVENTHRFAKAVSFGNNQEFIQGTREEQNIAEGCRRLIENAIICWNYLYLSQKIIDEKSPDRRQELVDSIRKGSIVSWQHLNLHGEYDFSDDRLQDSVGLKVSEILKLKKL